MEYRKDTRTQTTIRLPEDMKKRIQKEADKRDVSFNEMLCMLVYNALNGLGGGN